MLPNVTINASFGKFRAMNNFGSCLVVKRNTDT